MKKNVINLIIILITAIALFVLVYTSTGTDNISALLRNLDMKLLYIAIACMVMYWLVDAIILHIVCRTHVEDFRFINSLRFSMLGQFFNAITPFSSGGQPFQGYCMIKNGMKPGHAVSILAIKSMMFQFCLFVYSVLVFIFRAGYFIRTIPQFLLFFLIGLSINFILLIFYIVFLLNKTAAEKVVIWIFTLLNKIRIIKRPERYIGRIEAELESFKEGVDAYKGRKGGILKVFLLQMIQLTFFFSIPFFIFKAVDAGQNEFINIFCSQAILTMITLIVPSPGASGGAEGMSYLFLKHFFSNFGIAPAILIHRTITFYFNIIFGGIVSMISPEKPFQKNADTAIQ